MSNDFRTNGPPPLQVTVISWLWHGIMGLVGVGFLAWAAVVWNATDLVKRHEVEMNNYKQEMIRLQKELDEHEALDAHAGAKAMHAQEQRQLDDMQRQIDGRFSQLNEEVQQLRGRELENGKSRR